MRQEKFWFTIGGIVTVLAVALMLPAEAVAASKYKVLHKFTGNADGGSPYAGLIFDAAGNLYGTTGDGGSLGGGTVFKLTPNSDGTWKESVLYSFTGGADGGLPIAGVIFDAAGNLYGTTYAGGASGNGTVFKLTPKPGGSWKESVLYSFAGGADGANPYAGLIFDAVEKNLYGTTFSGGAFLVGTVFKLTPNSDGTWKESVLYTFTGGADGGQSYAGLIFDAVEKNLYGTTSSGGAFLAGTVFKLTPNSDGTWKESVLYSFTGGADGGSPRAGLIFDAAGYLYGTTVYGGKTSQCYHLGCGVVFKLDPTGKESVLRAFTWSHGGIFPEGALIFDTAGNLYSTTSLGGNLNYCKHNGCGVVFKLTPKADGSWVYSLLHVFLGKPAWDPLSGLVLDKGNFYGTAPACGGRCRGVVFEVTP